MPVHKIKKGLDLPIAGDPKQSIDAAVPKCTRVAIMADDYPGMRPRMLVGEGETVKRGQPLFEDRKNPGVFFAAPGAGRVIGVNRGKKRALQSVVIHLSESEQAGAAAADEIQPLSKHTGRDPAELSREDIVALLLESGDWTAFRTRPFSKVPAPDSVPYAIFVNAMDSNPLAADPEVVLAERREDFALGLKIVARLTEGRTHLCLRAGSPFAKGIEAKVDVQEFSGPHPAGTAGVHVNAIAPVSRARRVWTIAYQDVIAIGHLFDKGQLDVARVASVAGPLVKEPRLVRTRLGASLEELVPATELAGELAEGDYRLISGSVLSGKAAMGHIFGYLGRYHGQVSVVREGGEREFLGWLAPGTSKYSTIPTFLSALIGRSRRFAMTTSTNGSPRAMVPIGMYEQVMPMDILPTFLLRSMLVGDVEQAEKLGILELDEEDLALCTFVCPGKTNYGPILRANLNIIEKEG